MKQLVRFERKSFFVCCPFFIELETLCEKDWKPFDFAQDKLQADKAAQIIF